VTSSRRRSSLERAARCGNTGVAQSLYIHPFMLSRWRKEARDGKLMSKKIGTDQETAAELKELRKLRKAYERLKVEHDLLKKAIAFTSTRNATSSSSSPTTKKTTR
jgi:transposase